MEDPNITIEEYIRIEEEKAHRRGKPFIFIIKNLYVPFGIPFDPKRFYKDGGYMKKSVEAKVNSYTPYLYVSFSILFDPKQFYKDGGYTKKSAEAKRIEYISPNTHYLCPIRSIPLTLYTACYIRIRRICPQNRMIDLYNLCTNFVKFVNMALPPREQRHPYLRFEGLEYTNADIADFKERLGRIYERGVHRVHVFDFRGLTDLMAEGLSGRMLMEHKDAQGQSVFTNQALRKLSEVQGPLVHELILEFFSIFRNREVVLDLDTAEALQFQLGEARVSYELERDYSCIAGKSQELKKVTMTYLFYLRGMDVGSVNIPYLLARYLRRFALGRKCEAMISRGQFVACLAEHFGLLTEHKLQGLAAPYPPHLAGPARSLPQRVARLEEEIHRVRGALGRHREESKVDMGKALDADLVVTESNQIESEVQDERNWPGNDTDTDDANIRPIFNEESMAELQLTTECNIFTTRQ
uniref:Uncharacterized protein n=1 Tax=Tanacetum cinerariifolium TaxID=118510 RepID=A0A6L2NBR4_TANCI|nr:hypothetical protein [Tanacetum cinerariifolium]